MSKIKGLLVDLDGTIYNDSSPISGCCDTIRWLRDHKCPFRFITNTTMKSRASLRDKLEGMDIKVSINEIFSAAFAGSLYLRQKGSPGCYLLMLEDGKKEFSDLQQDNEEIDYVVVGDLGDKADFYKLNKAFKYLLQGAELIALQRNRFWLSDKGYEMDAGAFVAMLEYAANKEAKLIGKPSTTFFRMALEDLNLKPHEVLMIGDDIESDIAGAAQVGLQTCLVRTGKFLQDHLDRSNFKPDYILPSFADLPKSKLADQII